MEISIQNIIKCIIHRSRVKSTTSIRCQSSSSSAVIVGISFDFFHLLSSPLLNQSNAFSRQDPANGSPPCPPTAPQVLRPSWYTQSAPCTCSAHCQTMLIWQTSIKYFSVGTYFEAYNWFTYLYLPGFLPFISKWKKARICFLSAGERRRRRRINVWGLVCTYPTLLPKPQKAEPACCQPLPI